GQLGRHHVLHLLRAAPAAVLLRDADAEPAVPGQPLPEHPVRRVVEPVLRLPVAEAAERPLLGQGAPDLGPKRLGRRREVEVHRGGPYAASAARRSAARCSGWATFTSSWARSRCDL